MKGHVLNPSNGFRTAFYDKKNSIWRTDSLSDMQLLQNEETPAIHPYNYDPWVYHFSRQNMRPYSSHINEDPEESRPKTQEEIDALPENVAKRAKAAKEEEKLKAAKEEQAAKLDPLNAVNNPEAKAAAEAADDKKLLDAALKAADKAAAAPAKKPEEKKLVEYNADVGLWMYDSTLIQGDDATKKEDAKEGETPKVFPTEKVHILEPLAYQNRANTNTPNMRTTFYLGQH
jgi:hypothetical protein